MVEKSTLLPWLKRLRKKALSSAMGYGTKRECSPVAQLVEQVAVNHWVGSSSLSRGAILANSFKDFPTRYKFAGYTPGILWERKRYLFCPAPL